MSGAIARYADGIGVAKARIVPLDAAGRIQPPTTLVPDAHRAGLIVHAWTFRNENSFLAADFRVGTDPAAYGSAFAEYALFLAQGVDGLFSDNPDTAVEAVHDPRGRLTGRSRGRPPRTRLTARDRARQGWRSDQALRSPHSMAVAISSPNMSGVQVNAGTPRDARAAALSWS